jgi:hypothetical protein
LLPVAVVAVEDGAVVAVLVVLEQQLHLLFQRVLTTPLLWAQEERNIHQEVTLYFHQSRQLVVVEEVQNLVLAAHKLALRAVQAVEQPTKIVLELLVTHLQLAQVKETQVEIL